MKKIDEIKQKYTNNEISSEQALKQVLDLFDVIDEHEGTVVLRKKTG